jgi:hypothetical protein
MFDGRSFGSSTSTATGGCESGPAHLKLTGMAHLWIVPGTPGVTS